MPPKKDDSLIGEKITITCESALKGCRAEVVDENPGTGQFAVEILDGEHRGEETTVVEGQFEIAK